MKISEAVIQKRFIKEHNEHTFIATYKGHEISVTTIHRFGKPKWDHLKRYCIDVRGKDGRYAVNTYGDFHNMEDAIRSALKGAMLIL